MNIDNKETPTLQRIADTPPPVSPKMSRTLKKTRLEQLPLHETTTALMRAIRKTRIERLPEYFEQTCDWRQNEVAVICGAFQLTYQELDQQANRLAHLLIARGARNSDTIGILLEPSLDAYIALLGVLKAGAAFVPLDPSFSAEQIAFLANDAQIVDLVTTSAFHDKTNTLFCPVLALDQQYEALSVQPDTRPQIHVDSTSLCYVLYTTDTDGIGIPKGVAVSHASIVNFLRVATPIYRIKSNDRVYQGMPITHNASFMEIWPTWIAGATVITGTPASQRLDHELTEFLIRQHITVLCGEPKVLAAIEREVPSLRIILISGQGCPADLVSHWARPRRRMLSMYGPAETTVMAIWCELFPNRPVTVGSPLPTYQLYLMDDQSRPVADEQIGEIYIGGPGVAIGYLNAPDLTTERFMPNPVEHDRDMVPRLYRTGYLGRVTPLGEIEYLGKIDIQTKDLGYQLEPDTIKQVIPPLETTTSLGAIALTSQFEVEEITRIKATRFRIPNIKNAYKHIMTDSLYRNSLFTMASTFLLGGLGFFFWIIIARLYKPEDVGIATTLISIMTLLSNFTILGLHSSLNRYLPKSANKNDLINSAFIIVMLVTLLTSGIFLGGIQLFSPQLSFLRSNFFYIASFTIFIIFNSWNMLTDSVFLAFRAASNILIKNSVISIAKLLLPFAFIALGAYGIFTSTALAFTLGVLISLAILFLAFHVRFSSTINISLIKETLTYSFANYITSFMFNLPSLVLPVIILNTLSAKYAAYYYVASMIQSILQIIPVAASQALLTEGSYNEAALKKHVKKALTTISVILIPTTCIIILFGNILLRIFGKSYATESLQFLQLYAASTIFTAILLISNAIMNIKRQVKLLVIWNVTSSLLTLYLSYAFISSKLVGIGWGWILGQAITAGISLFFIARNYWDTPPQANSAKVQASSIRMSGVEYR